MEKLTQLIGSLDKIEINLVRRYYLYSKQKENLLRNKLFDLLINNPGIKQSRIAEELKISLSGSSFSVLQKRLIDDILKILLVAQGPKKFPSKYREAKYRCGLLLVEIDVLLNKGSNETLLMDKIYQAERLANKFELNNEKIIINDHKKEYIGRRKGPDVYNKAHANDLDNFKIVREKLEAQDFFRKLIMPNLFLTNKEVNFTQQAIESTEQLRILSEKNSSAHIKYYYLRSSIYCNHLLNNYILAKEYAIEFYKLIKENKILYSSDNVGGAFMLLATISIYLGDGEKAIEYANNGSPYFHKSSINMATLNENLFLGYLMIKDYERANEVVNVVTSYKIIKTKAFLKAKWLYYKANLLFAQGLYSETLSLLQKQSALLADKSGWRLGYKILEMMCIIELDNSSWLDYRVETFRKLLANVKNENIQRPKMILYIIKQFIRNAYNFTVTNQQCEDKLKFLTEAKNDFRYDPKGYEVIRFDEWWFQKTNELNRKRAQIN